ncbi:hypothetical protein [Streptosporangium sp. NBC_01756]|uniref:hypothetical protein n=1 Tax=Streptosporangium sp. NBC_01756 TaxID=2975950 RepID=UPI002DD9DE0C|nr:hypothetical protein [Streptosporangium sp. NBC_01756]WSC89058.1 hypothetical protein OIE48_12950 [Streptosporangium sp. NBC_01756]
MRQPDEYAMAGQACGISSRSSPDTERSALGPPAWRRRGQESGRSCSVDDCDPEVDRFLGRLGIDLVWMDGLAEFEHIIAVVEEKHSSGGAFVGWP